MLMVVGVVVLFTIFPPGSLDYPCTIAKGFHLVAQGDGKSEIWMTRDSGAYVFNSQILQIGKSKNLIFGEIASKGDGYFVIDVNSNLIRSQLTRDQLKKSLSDFGVDPNANFYPPEDFNRKVIQFQENGINDEMKSSNDRPPRTIID